MYIQAKINKDDLAEIKTAEKPTVFLGGDCSEDNKWRKDLIRAFPSISFIDPYDTKWAPEENIYTELAAAAGSDYCVFYKGGAGTAKEMKFLDYLGYGYESYDDLETLKAWLTGLEKPNKLACVSDVLRVIASIGTGPINRFFSVGLHGEASMTETGPGLPCRLLEFPNLRQAHSWDCGATATEAVMQYYGFDVRGDEALKELKTNKNGTSVKEIIGFFEKKGFNVFSGTGTLKDIKMNVERGMPCIMPIQAYPDKQTEGWEDGWTNGHYVTAVGYTAKHIILSDPSSVQDAYLPDEEFDRRWHDEDAKKTHLDHFMIVPFGKKQNFQWDKILPLED